MTIQEAIEEKLTSAFSPTHLEVENESRNHNVPAGSETHFRVVVVSDAFEGKLPVARHRAVHGVLAEELKGGVHALSVRALTTAQWSVDQTPLSSPPCLGGEKKAPRG